ncbi:MAG TPA: TlpA disulfide reductase family protein [Steroidobacteraceae bacterium]|nr:TlpA disulfide reductase family protein [Steroidobacteraceae bacterium]
MTGRGLGLALVVVCAGGLCGFLAAHWLGQRHPAGAGVAQPVSDATGGSSVPPNPASPAQLASPEASSPKHPIPVVLPDLSLADTAGTRHALTEWRGRPLIINFWATWCAPCRREIPLLKSLRRQHSAEGLEVIGIAVDFRDAVQRYSHEMGIDYPVLVGEQDGLDAIAAFGMDTLFPFSVFVDRQGRIVTLKVGELHADDAGLILEKVGSVDRGTLELATARHEIADAMAALAAQRARTPPPPGQSP